MGATREEEFGMKTEWMVLTFTGRRREGLVGGGGNKEPRFNMLSWKCPWQMFS